MRRVSDGGRELVQGILPFADPPDATAEELATRLASILERPVRVAFGRSRRTPVTVQPDTQAELRVRLHSFFASAPPDVVEALARWMRAGRRARRACDRLDRWIEARLEALPPERPRAVALRTQGTCFDLLRLRDLVIDDLVPELREAPPQVTWGARGRSRGVHSLHLGSFDPDTRLVRVHPVLDHDAVPEFFVRFVLFHELLHAAIAPRRAADGRQLHHPPEFQERERRHPDYAQALAWEERNLPELIARARRGTGL